MKELVVLLNKTEGSATFRTAVQDSHLFTYPIISVFASELVAQSSTEQYMRCYNKVTQNSFFKYVFSKN